MIILNKQQHSPALLHVKKALMAVLITCIGSVPVMASDAFPVGSVSFFKLIQCPDGWGAYKEGAGRLFVPLPENETNENTVGTPLTTEESREHSHSYSTKFKTKDIQFALAGGAKKLAKKKKYTVSGTSGSASTGLPYVQLMACEKFDEPNGLADQLPSGMMMYTIDVECPSGFSEPEELRGLLQVGLPNGGESGLQFGSTKPLYGEARTHDHKFSGMAKLSAKGVTGSSSCCNGGFAKSKKYSFSSDTDVADTGLPYIELLQCAKD